MKIYEFLGFLLIFWKFRVYGVDSLWKVSVLSRKLWSLADLLGSWLFCKF